MIIEERVSLVCTKCQVEKPVADFYVDRNRKKGYYPSCRACVALGVKDWRRRNPAKTSAYNRNWRTDNPDKWRALKLAQYGIGPEDYDRLLEQQNGVCAICQKECATGQRISVDHDHITGKVRGLLCRKCNTAIGHLNDDPDLLRAALSYLEKAK